MTHDPMNTDQHIELLEEQIPGLRFTVPFTAGVPIQAFGRLDDEYFEFCWKRHTAWLAIGSPAADQPFSPSEEKVADLLSDLLGCTQEDALQAAKRRPSLDDAAHSDAWVVVEPRRYAQVDTTNDEDQDVLVQLFGALYARATTASAD